MNKIACLFSVFYFCFLQIKAQDTKPAVSAEELAKKLSNPVASLISVPFQNNTDVGIGPYNGSRNTLNIQPVIPLSLNSTYNLITRVVLPVVSQHDIIAAGSNQSGLSDALMSAFISPKVSDITWGIGPCMLLPVATDNLLGTKKWGIGPTALILKQTKGYTVGGLMNQIWSFAGDKTRADISQMYLQPFLSYNWKSGAGVGISAEITQNWNASTTNAYIVPTVSAITKIGTQTVQLTIGPRLQVSAADGNKAAMGVRAALSFVFPK